MAEQEIPIAVHEEYWNAALLQRVQRLCNLQREWAVVVVADPALEQVAENIERFGPARVCGDEPGKQFHNVRPRRVQVQV